MPKKELRRRKEDAASAGNDPGVVSAAVGLERKARIVESARALGRSKSWVVNQIMLLSEKVNFETYPLPPQKNGHSARRRQASQAAAT